MQNGARILWRDEDPEVEVVEKDKLQFNRYLALSRSPDESL